MLTARRLVISLLAAAAVVGIGWAFTTSQPDHTVRFVQGVEGVYPAQGDLDLRQARIGIDLEPGLTGVLRIDGVEIPEDQLERVDPLNQVFYTPGPGKETGRLDPGRHCATALYWETVQDRDHARTFRWCFNVH